jgi:RNA polymerase sigma factor (sigma-70 family)
MPRLSDGGGASTASTEFEPDRALPERLERLAAGDRDALAELFVEYGDQVYRTAVRLTASRPDAEDVTQVVFLRLAGVVRGFTGPNASFPGWLRRITVRQSLMHLRSGRRRREVDVAGIATLVAPSPSDVDRLSLERALSRLSDDLRTVFLLKEVEGYTHGEIAELLGISVANSEVRLHRARRALRELLGGSR